MAGRNFDLSIIINALDKTGSTFQGLDSNLKLTNSQLNTIALTSAATFGAMVYGLNKAANAAAEQQTAEINLAQAMIKTGQYTDENFQSNLKLASSLQEITKFGDETIIASQALLSTFVKDANAIKQLTPLILDLATAKGMDLNNAAMLVAKSIGSSTNALSRYGIEIEGAAGSTERTQSTINELSNLFAGKAESDALGYSGQMAILKNRISDIQESIGTLLLPKLTDLGSSITLRAKEFQNWIETHKELTSAISGVSLSFIGIIALVSSLAIIIPKVTTAFLFLGTILKTHPILAIASILIPLILNWDKLRNSINENSTAGRIIAGVMDTLKATFLAVSNVLGALNLNFKALWQSMSLNFKGAAESMQQAGILISNIPAKIKDTYSKIDSITNDSNKNRQDKEFETYDIIEKMQEKYKNSFDLHQNEMTNSEKKALEEKEKMNANYHKNLLAIAESKKETDAQGYTDALIAEKEYLDQKLIQLEENKNLDLASNQAYYDLLNEKRLINEQLELQSQFKMKQGFLMALTEIKAYQINWYNWYKQNVNAMNQVFTNAFTNAFMTIGTGWENFANSFKNIGQELLRILVSSVIEQMVKRWGIGQMAMAAATMVWRGVVLLAQAAVSAASAISSALAALPFPWNIAAAAAAGIAAYAMVASYFATGTRGFSGGMAIVGENGPELVNLPSGSDVLNNPETRNILNSNRGRKSNGNVINVNIDFGGSTFMGTVDEITDALSDRIYKNLKLNAVI